jgi:hypothetical protein
LLINQKLRELCKHAGLIAVIKRKRFGNFGYGIRMIQTNADEIIFENEQKVESGKAQTGLSGRWRELFTRAESERIQNKDKQ